MRNFFGLYSLTLVGMLAFSISSFAEQPVVPGSHELKVSRPTANPILEGTVVIKAVDLKEDSPFLRVKTTDGSSKDYLIKTCDETCQKSINACKGGEQCSIRGRIDESAPSIMAEFVRVGATAITGAETKTTKTGHVFTRDTSNPKLGEAWRDPSGMIWGDIVKKADGTPHFMNHKDATAYCKSIGAELPSGWQSSQNKSNGGQNSDFVRLREYMGATSGSYDGYTPRVVPNLTHVQGGETGSRYFWSSSVLPDDSNYAYVFDGRYGAFDDGNRVYDAGYSVRCVARR